MGKKKRRWLTVLAWLGWVVAAGITIGTLASEIVRDHPWFFSRAFGLAALAGAVLTLGLWLDRISLPTRTALNVGLKAGIKIGRMEERMGKRFPSGEWNDPRVLLSEQIIEGKGYDTPSGGWRSW